jgi:hypothetical protein
MQQRGLLPGARIPVVKARKMARCKDSPTGAHHWMLDSRSQGVCKHCGERRSFAVEVI